MSKTDVVRVGILSFAHMHAFSYASSLNTLPDVVCSGIWDPVASRRMEMAAKFSVEEFDSCNELLSSVDAVIVCSENVNHRKDVEAVARAGKHVLCEKPLASTYADAVAMVCACADAGVKLMTSFSCRYHPSFGRLKDTVAVGDLGMLLAVKATNQGMCPGGWFIDPMLSGGGAVIDHTVHVLDLMRVLTGAEVVSVYAEVDSRMFNRGFDDTGLLTLEFTNGTFATIDCSWSRPKNNPIWGNVKLDVTGTRGTASLDMFRQVVEMVSDVSGKVTHEYWGDDADLAMIKAFVSCITNDTEPPITGEDGAAAVRVVEAAYQSARTNTVVHLC